MLPDQLRKQVACYSCRGEGVIHQRHYNSFHCSRCCGTGTLKGRLPGELDMMCPDCLGRGRVDEREDVTEECPVCDGKGVIEY